LFDAVRCARILARGNEVLSGGSVPNTHHGGCQCGAVRYRVDIDLSKPVMQCNCSICSRTGTLLSFVPPTAFTLEKGED